jgi:hypothetical protein
LDKLKAQRRCLDEQIATAATATQAANVDAATLAERLMEEIGKMFSSLSSLPTPLVKD